jgi:TPP-dependent trihydroxycyclohexane-1,2-dione (THcHDO) dehydratase
MNNIYLEKIAGFAQKLNETKAGGGNKALSVRTHIDAKGVAGRKLGAPTNANILAGLGSSSKMHSFNTGSKNQMSVNNKTFMGLGQKSTKVTVDAKQMKQTGDVLAANSIHDRLAGNRHAAKVKSEMAALKAGPAKAEATGVKGILGKAVGLARKNPKTAIAGGIGAGLLGAKALSGKKQDEMPQGYYQ